MQTRERKGNQLQVNQVLIQKIFSKKGLENLKVCFKAKNKNNLKK